MSENEGKKTGMLKKGLSGLKRIPKVIRNLFLGILVVVIAYWGLSNSSIFSTHSKVTTFGLQNVGELVTQSAHVTVIQDTEKERDFFNLFKIPFTKSRIIFSYDFTVDASVNFESITYSINEEKKEIEVSLPHAKHYKRSMGDT